MTDLNNSIVLTVHNKEATIASILQAVIDQSSPKTIEVIVVLDGCSDRTEQIVNQIARQVTKRIKIIIVLTDDVWETRANNAGIKEASGDFVTIVQDDMLILEKNWDEKLMKVFDKHNVFSVSGRACHEFILDNSLMVPIDLKGREYPLGSVSIMGRVVAKLISWFKPYFIYKYWSPVGFALSINRGPLMIRRSHLEQLGYIDEEFAPFELDDLDLCCRAYKKFGLKSASCPVYYKEIGGSKATNSNSRRVSEKAYKKNSAIIAQRHAELAKKS